MLKNETSNEMHSTNNRVGRKMRTNVKAVQSEDLSRKEPIPKFLSEGPLLSLNVLVNGERAL